MVECPCGECTVRLTFRPELHGLCSVSGGARKCEQRAKQELGVAARLLGSQRVVQLRSACCWACVGAGRLDGAHAGVLTLQPSSTARTCFDGTLSDAESETYTAPLRVTLVSPAVPYWEAAAAPPTTPAAPAVTLHAGNVLACFNDESGGFDMPLWAINGVKDLCENAHPPGEGGGGCDYAPVCRHCLLPLHYEQARSFEGADGPKGDPRNRVHWTCPRDRRDRKGLPVAAPRLSGAAGGCALE